MRRCVVVAVCAACSFRHGSSGGVVDGTTSDVPPGLDDAGHEIDTWNVDTAADFATGQRVDVGIDPWGSITPAGYFYGSIYATGIDGMALWHPNDPSFSVDTAAGVATTGANLWAGNALSAGTTSLSTLGVTGNTFSAYGIAEVYLAAGTHQIQITADDVAFIEIASPHTTQYTTVAVSKGSAATMAFNAPVADWYPIRIGWSSTASGWNIDLQDTPPAGSARHFTRSELRGRLEEARGLMQLVYNRQLLLGSRSSHQLAGDMMPSLSLPLYGQPSAGNVWSARWVGQFHADAAGTYTLQVDSVAGDRLAIGGQSGGSNFTRDVTSASQSSVSFTSSGAGWYDIACDLNEPATASAALALQVASGPEFAGMPLPRARTRAVEPPGDRLVGTQNTTPQSLPDQSQTTMTLPAMVALSNETVTSIVVRAFITNPEYSSLAITLANPNGDTFVLPTTGAFSLNGNGDATFYWTVDASTAGAATLLANATVGGSSWTLTVRDNSNTSGNTGGQVNDVELLLHTAGGPPAVATDSTWTSQVIDTMTGLVSVDSVAWDERAPSQPATVRVRACDAACTNEAWVPATQGAGLDLGMGHRYVQAEVEMHSDGAKVPEVGRLTVVYKRNAP